MYFSIQLLRDRTSNGVARYFAPPLYSFNTGIAKSNIMHLPGLESAISAAVIFPKIIPVLILQAYAEFVGNSIIETKYHEKSIHISNRLDRC